MKAIITLSLGICLCAPLHVHGQVHEVPARTDDNLIIAAYNVQFFGQLDHDLEKLATVIQHFDVCGLIEVKAESEIPKLVAALEAKTGNDWGYTFGVRTNRPSGTYHEAFGFVWRRDRVDLGDGVTGNIWDPEEAFRNDPFLASFRRKNFDFVMALIHTRWSDDSEGSRAGEVAAAVDQIHWMKSFIEERDLIFAGDFNYPGTAPALQQMASEANLEQLDADSLSTFKTDGSGFASAYDHIFVGRSGETRSQLVPGECETLDVCRLVYGDNSALNMRKARRELSDHLPVFAVFRVDAEDDD